MLLGITGRKRAGKDTVASILARKYEFNVYSFATPLKKVCRDLFCLTDEQLYGTTLDKEHIDPRWGISARVIQQKFGTDLIRERLLQVFPELSEILNGESLWVYLMRLKLSQAILPLVISDVRFPDEERLIREFGGKIIRVNRSIEKDGTSEHISEHGQDQIRADFTLKNDGTIQELEQKITSLILKI
jgi:hypothetical protein